MVRDPARAARARNHALGQRTTAAPRWRRIPKTAAAS
jgi:hypothetical protein